MILILKITQHRGGCYNRVYRRKREIWKGVSSLLIQRLPLCRWSLSLVGEEEDNRCDGGALGAPLWVALLSVLSRRDGS
jgi:hypothetical protein